MSAQGELVAAPTSAAPIVYDVTEEAIAEARVRCEALSCDTAEGYEETRVAIGKLRGTRTAIEARRKELKEPSLEYGRQVDARAKLLTSKIEEIEKPLQAKKDAADVTRAEAKRQAEEAALVAREAELKAQREADEARIKAEQEAESKRIADERAVFEVAKKKAEEERAADDARRAEEQAKIDAQRAELDARERAIDDEKAAAARAEADRVAKAKAEEDAKVAAARAVVAAEERRVAEEAEVARLEALRPDIEKIRAWGAVVRVAGPTANIPDVASPDAKAAIAWTLGRLSKVCNEVADALETFTPRKGAK